MEKMKYAILLLIGLLAGAMGATMVVNALRQRDAYARGVMDVMQHHYAGLREDIRARRCDAGKSALAITRLRATTDDIEASIYADSTPDAPFHEFTQRLNDALAAVPNPPPSDCVALAPFVQKIGKVCDDCHQQYR
jgi:cytochrome c556